MNYLRANGWLQHPGKTAEGKPDRDKSRLLHNCLMPFDDLDPNDQQKDHRAILSLPDTVALVGFMIDFFPDLTLSV